MIKKILNKFIKLQKFDGNVNMSSLNTSIFIFGLVCDLPSKKICGGMVLFNSPFKHKKSYIDFETCDRKYGMCKYAYGVSVYKWKWKCEKILHPINNNS